MSRYAHFFLCHNRGREDSFLETVALTRLPEELPSFDGVTGWPTKSWSGNLYFTITTSATPPAVTEVEKWDGQTHKR